MKKSYPPETAGRQAISNVPVCYKEWRLSDVKKMLFEKKKNLETINYIYVLDKSKKLWGVFSIKEIFRRPASLRVEAIAQKNLVAVRPRTDQEKVAILALNHNLKSVPVVDKNNKFLGIVPSDVILNILHSEDVEDFLKMTGIRSSFQKILKGSSFYLAKVRLPWLVVGLLGGVLAAQIMNYFEASLKNYFVLTSFIPLILYLASANGNQTETLFIRSSVIESRINIRKYFLREIAAGLLISLVLGGLISLISVFWFKSSFYMGFILAVSLFLTILAAVTIGVFIPWTLIKLKKDPAVGTGPFATILRDVLSLLIYFSVSLFLLSLV